MTDNEIKNYFGDNTVYKFIGTPDQIVPLLIDKGIAVNYIVANYTVYLTCSESLDSMLNDSLSVFSTPGV